ncbi:hypothetical protein OCOL_001475 [Ordospora colligata]
MSINKSRSITADYKELNELEMLNDVQNIDDCIRTLNTHLNSLKYRIDYLTEKTEKARKKLKCIIDDPNKYENDEHKTNNIIIEVIDQFDDIDACRRNVATDIEKVKFVMDRYLDIKNKHYIMDYARDKFKVFVDLMNDLRLHEIVVLNSIKSGKDVLNEFCGILSNHRSRTVVNLGEFSDHKTMHDEIKQRMELFRILYHEKLNEFGIYGDKEQLGAYIENGHLLCSTNGKVVFMKDIVYNRNGAIVELIIPALKMDVSTNQLYGLHMYFVIKTLNDVLKNVRSKDGSDKNTDKDASNNNNVYIINEDKIELLQKLIYKIENCKDKIDDDDVMSIMNLLKIGTPKIRCVVNDFAKSKYVHLFSKQAYANVRSMVGEIIRDMENTSTNVHEWDNVINSIDSEICVEICVIGTMICTVWCDAYGTRCGIDSETMRKVMQVKSVITKLVKLMCIMTPIIGCIWMIMKLKMYKAVNKNHRSGINGVIGNNVMTEVIGMLMIPYAMMCGMISIKERRGIMRDEVMNVLTMMLGVIVGMKYMGNMNTSNVYDGVVMGGMFLAGLLRMSEMVYRSNCMFVHEMNVRMLRMAVVIAMAVGIIMLDKVFGMKREKKNGVVNGVVVFVMLSVTVVNDVMQSRMMNELRKSAIEIVELCI